MKKYAFYQCEFGYLKLEYAGGKITAIMRSDRIDDVDEHSKVSDYTYGQLREYFDGKRKNFDFPYKLEGTEFQMKVWKALQGIPYGETRSYKDIAVAVGCPQGARAVGMANNRNPILIAVPCHRVIGADGKLVGYGCGLDMKEALLQLESDNK